MTVTLTSKTYQSMTETWYSTTSLPKRFQHALEIAMWMGIEYIWIDALCIVQDSRDDWLTQSAKMGDIYTNSHCNIAATSSDPDKGCFTDRLTYMVEPYPVHDPRTNDGDRTHVIGYDDFWANSLLDAPLHRRGWVLQERLLSPRTIHFGQEQMFWECRCQMACEAYPDGIPDQFRNMRARSWRQADEMLDPKNKISSSQLDITRALSNLNLGWLTPKWFTSDPATAYRQQTWKIWSKTVMTYMECKLSYGEDKLVAISGIAQKVAEATGERYLAGHWENTMLPQSLLWYVLGRKQADGASSVRSTSGGHRHYRASSWSWASLEAKVIWNWPAGCDKVLIDIAKTKVEHTEGTKFGRVASAEMVIRGHLLRADVEVAIEDPDSVPEENGLYTLYFYNSGQTASLSEPSKQPRLSMQPTIYLDTPMMPQSTSMDVYLLPICSGWRGRSGIRSTALAGLLLRKAEFVAGKGKYERVGMFGLDDHQARMLCGLSEQPAKGVEIALAGMLKEQLVLM